MINAFILLAMLGLLLMSVVRSVLAAEPAAGGDALEIGGWLGENWSWLVPTALLVADKIVTITPTKYDDLILTGLKSMIGLVRPKRRGN